ncbi:MAG: hypothetical protein WCY29_01440 [Novosphingobium sp.]
MTMFHLALIALVLSAISILALCAGDPKRRRTAGDMSGGMTPARRRSLAAVSCIPGLVCALLGDAAAFLMWLGGCALVGWACAAFFRPRSSGGQGTH